MLGTTIAAAKYGMKPIEPVADRGSRKLSSSAAIARPHRMSASDSIEGGAAGAPRYRRYVQTTATPATAVT